METYKTGQGTLARLATWVALVVLAFLGAYEVFSWMHSQTDRPLIDSALTRRLPGLGVPLTWKLLVCIALFLAALWGVRRVMSRASVADTLIETEGELKKVSWPSSSELRNATLVVIAVTVLLTTSLAMIDLVLTTLFRLIF